MKTTKTILSYLIDCLQHNVSTISFRLNNNDALQVSFSIKELNHFVRKYGGESHILLPIADKLEFPFEKIESFGYKTN